MQHRTSFVYFSWKTDKFHFNPGALGKTDPRGLHFAHKYVQIDLQCKKIKTSSNRTGLFTSKMGFTPKSLNQIAANGGIEVRKITYHAHTLHFSEILTVLSKRGEKIKNLHGSHKILSSS